MSKNVKPNFVGLLFDRSIQKDQPCGIVFLVYLSKIPRTKTLLELVNTIYSEIKCEILHAHLITVLKLIKNSSLIFIKQNYSY
jgi:hypothetical protein